MKRDWRIYDWRREIRFCSSLSLSFSLARAAKCTFAAHRRRASNSRPTRGGPRSIIKTRLRVVLRFFLESERLITRHKSDALLASD
jgi:hypothetical protein